MKLEQLFDTNLLEEMIQKRYVTKRYHPELPIYILNYAPSCAFDLMWNEVTEQCRGLIADEEGNVVSRPLRKFFNLNTAYRPETHIDALPSEPAEVYEKMDGCLGVVWKYRGQAGVATRGSFQSDMSEWATKFLNTQYKEWVEWYVNTELASPVTYICEIISPVSKIVVDYDFEDLVLLTVIYNTTGKEYTRKSLEFCSWPGRIVEAYPYSLQDCVRIQEKGTKLDHENREGYIVFFRNSGLRVKVKFDEYMRLHRLITGVTPKVIFKELLEIEEAATEWVGKLGFDPELYRKGRIAEILLDTPKDFRMWYWMWVNRFLTAKNDIIIGAQALVMKVQTQNLNDRSAQAKEILKYPKLAAVAFALLDGNNQKADNAAWKQTKSLVSSEDVYRRDTDK